MSSELEQRKQRWASFGEKFNTIEMQLQAQAQSVLTNLHIPSTVDEVLDAEIKLQEIKSVQKAIREKRLELISRPLGDLEKRISSPEKTLDEPILKLTEGIKKIKSEHEARKAKEQQRQAEIQRVTAIAQKHHAEQEQKCEAKVQEQVQKAYSYALSSGTVSKENLQEYIKKCSDKLNVLDFAPDPLTLSNSILDEQTLSSLTNISFDSNKYVEKLRALMQEKFLLFELDLQNKKEALANAEKEKQEALRKAEEEAQAAKTLAEVKSRSQSLVVEEEFKGLKKSYAVETNDSEECILAIIMAFVSNFNEVKEHLRLRSSMLNLKVDQMAEALAKLKNKDNRWEFTGVTFKVVEKL